MKRRSERWCHDCRWFREGKHYSDSACTNAEVVACYGGTEDIAAGAMQQMDDGPTNCWKWEEPK